MGSTLTAPPGKRLMIFVIGAQAADFTTSLGCVWKEAFSFLPHSPFLSWGKWWSVGFLEILSPKLTNRYFWGVSPTFFCRVFPLGFRGAPPNFGGLPLHFGGLPLNLAGVPLNFWCFPLNWWWTFDPSKYVSKTRIEDHGMPWSSKSRSYGDWCNWGCQFSKNQWGCAYVYIYIMYIDI